MTGREADDVLIRALAPRYEDGARLPPGSAARRSRLRLPLKALLRLLKTEGVIFVEESGEVLGVRPRKTAAALTITERLPARRRLIERMEGEL